MDLESLVHFREHCTRHIERERERERGRDGERQRLSIKLLFSLFSVDLMKCHCGCSHRFLCHETATYHRPVKARTYSVSDMKQADKGTYIF